MGKKITTAVEVFWQVPGAVAIAFLWFLARRSRGVMTEAACGLLIIYFSLSWALTHWLYFEQGHLSDRDYDLHWTWFIALDSLFAALLAVIRAPLLTVLLFLLAIVYGALRVRLEPYGDIERLLDSHYLESYLTWLSLLMYSLFSARDS